MISTRWSTGNSHLLPPRPAPLVEPPPPRLLERPAVFVGAALVTGIAVGLLLKWGWRR